MALIIKRMERYSYVPTIKMDALPVELLCAIFTEVEKEDLPSCTSVSQQWRQIKLPLLFNDLRISFLQDEREEPATLQWHMTNSPVLLPTFLEFLKRSPDIATYVRSLALTAWTDENGLALVQDSEGPELHEDSDSDDSEIDLPVALMQTNPETLFLVLVQLPSLANLKLIDVAVGENHEPSLELVVDRHLDRLSLIFEGLISKHYQGQTLPKHILRPLSFFRSVNALSLSDISMHDTSLVDGSGMAGWPLPQYAFKHLEILDVFTPGLLFSTLMLSRSLFQSVETFKMQNIIHSGHIDMVVFENIIAQVSPSLLYLEPPDCKLFVLPLFPWLNARLSSYLSVASHNNRHAASPPAQVRNLTFQTYAPQLG